MEVKIEIDGKEFEITEGMKLKLVRITLGLTEMDVASKMYTTKQTISNIENDKASKKMFALYAFVLQEYIKSN